MAEEWFALTATSITEDQIFFPIIPALFIPAIQP